jgi:hypothetical protein
MIKALLTAASLILSYNAFAVESETSIFEATNIMHFDYKLLHKCLKSSWKAASPNEDQKSEAKSLVVGAKDVLAEHKDALKKDKKELMRAWFEYPISTQKVEDAERALRKDIVAVHSAYRDAKINALNLLTSDQKGTFNSTFKSCFKKTGDEQEESEEIRD